MSDPSEPPRDEPPPTEPGQEHAPHGVVETLREELHEAVEHVPEPVRWTVGKLVRITLVALLALIVIVIASAALYLANRTELVAHELALVLNHELAVRSDVALALRDIKGNPFAGFRVIEPQVRYRSDGAPLLEAHEMRVSYSPLALLRGRGEPIDIRIDHPVIHLDRGPRGGWRLPQWQGGGRHPGKEAGGRSYAFNLDITDAQLDAPAPLGRIDGMELRAVGSTGRTTRVELQQLSWRQGPWHSRLERLAASLVSDPDSVHVRVRELRTGDLGLRLDGDWRTGGERVLHADVQRVRWRWLAEVFDNDEFDVPGEGRLTLDAVQSSRWRGRFTADADWDSLAILGHGRFDWDGQRLALDSLSGQSPAGDLDGQLRWSKLGWTLQGTARGADPSHWHAIRLDGWPEGKLNGTFRYVVDSRGRVNSSRLDARTIPSEWAGWRIDSATVRVVFPATAADTFDVTAFRRGGRFVLAGRVGRGGWSGPYTLDQFPLEEWPDGRASGLVGTLVHGEGRVESRGGGLWVSGDLSGARSTWSAAEFSRWRLSGLQGQLLPKPDLTSRLSTRDGFFVGVHLDSAEAQIHVVDQALTFSALRASAGDTVLTAGGNADWSGSHWHVRLTSANAASSQFAWTAEPPVEISGDPEGTLFERVIANDRDAHFEARGRWAAPGGAYDVSLTGRGLDLSRLGLPSEWELSGRADAALVVSGGSGDPRWTFDARASQPGFGGHACDSLAVSLAGQQHRLEARDFLYRLEGGELRASGRVERTARPWPDSLTATAVVRWLQDAGAWDGVVEAKALSVSRLGAIAPAADGWTGVVAGRLELGGSPPHPEFDLDATADDIGWRDYVAQHVQAQAAYHGGMLTVPNTRVTMQDVVSTLRGRLPIELALGRAPELPEAEMEWDVDVPRGDLKVLPALVPLIQSAHGGFDLVARITGTTHHPRLAGKAHVRDGVIRPAGREEVLEGVSADLHFDESRVVLDTLSARQGRTGRVWSHGSLAMNGFDPGHYRFDLGLRDFASSQEGLYAALFDGDFQITDGPNVYGQRLPLVTGDVRVQRGVVEFDFANQTEVQKRAATTEPLYWIYSIHLTADSNLRWRPPNGDIEFDADLNMQQTPDSLLIFGEMHLVKGHYYFLSNRFNVTQADLTFDNQKGVDPTLDIVADTKLKPSLRELASGGTWGSSPPPIEDITATITGRSSQPIIALSSASGWDQREIIGELTFGRFGDNPLSLGATDWLQNSLTRQLSSQLSRDLAKTFNDAINQWEVERDQGELIGGEGAVVMSVGGDINARTSWTYRQRLPGLDRPVSTLNAATATSLFDRDVEVQYRINRFIYATTEVTQRRVGQILPGQNNTDFNVNLKARWEY